MVRWCHEEVDPVRSTILIGTFILHDTGQSLVGSASCLGIAGTLAPLTHQPFSGRMIIDRALDCPLIRFRSLQMPHAITLARGKEQAQ